MEVYRAQVLVCGGTGCIFPESVDLYRTLKTEIRKHNLNHEVEVLRTACLGLCELGPVVLVYPEGVLYNKVKTEDIAELVESHFIHNKVLERLQYQVSEGEGKVRNLNKLDFFKKQLRIALRNCGIIDPENIDEYIACEGYKALEKVLTEMSPLEVIENVVKSGLRGRGGGGFSTGMKFRDEYIAHVKDKKCPAKVCRSLVQYVILEDKCKGCGLCTRNCNIGAISGKLQEDHKIDTNICVKCGMCIHICRFKAIVKI